MRIANSYLLSFTPFYYADKSYSLCFYFYSPIYDITTAFDMSAWLLSCYSSKEHYPVETAKKHKKRRAFVALPEVKSALVKDAYSPIPVDKALYKLPLINNVNTPYLDADEYIDSEIQYLYSSMLLNNAFRQVEYGAGDKVVNAFLPLVTTLTRNVTNAVLQELLNISIINNVSKIDEFTESFMVGEGLLNNIEVSYNPVDIIDGIIPQLDDSVINYKFIEQLNSTLGVKMESIFDTYLSRQILSILNYKDDILQQLGSAYVLYSGSITDCLPTYRVEHAQDVALQSLFSGLMLHEILGESSSLLGATRLQEWVGEPSSLGGGINSSVNSGDILSLDSSESILPAFVSSFEGCDNGLSRDAIIDIPLVNFAIYHAANNVVDIIGDALLKIIYEGSYSTLEDSSLHYLLPLELEVSGFAKEIYSPAFSVSESETFNKTLNNNGSLSKEESYQGVFASNAVIGDEESSQGMFVPDASVNEDESLQGIFVPNAIMDKEESSQGLFSLNATVSKPETSQGVFSPDAVINGEESSLGVFVPDVTVNEPEISEKMLIYNTSLNEPEISEKMLIYNTSLNEPEISEKMLVYNSTINRPDISEKILTHSIIMDKLEISRSVSVFNGVISNMWGRALFNNIEEALNTDYIEVIPSLISKKFIIDNPLGRMFIRSVLNAISTDISSAGIDRTLNVVVDSLANSGVSKYFDAQLVESDLASLLDIYESSLDYANVEAIHNEVVDEILSDEVDNGFISRTFNSLLTKDIDDGLVNTLVKNYVIMRGFDLLNHPSVNYDGRFTGNPEYSNLSILKDAIPLRGFDKVIRDRLFISVLGNNVDYAFLRYLGMVINSGKFDFSSLSARDAYGKPDIADFSSLLDKDTLSVLNKEIKASKVFTMADSMESNVIDIEVIGTEYLADDSELDVYSPIEKVYDGGVIEPTSSVRLAAIVQAVVQLPLKGFGLIKDVILSVMNSFRRNKKRMRFDDDIHGNKPEDVKIPPQPNKKIWLQQGKSQSWHIWPRRKTR